MIKIYVGLYFADNLHSEGDLGKVVERVEGGRWEVHWMSGDMDHTFETDEGINEMIKGAP